VCTLSFLPETNGYLVAMNRDELLTRGTAQPPAIQTVRGVKALFPTDVEGGTWIAVTERGDTWALLNRNGGTRSPKNVSRGQLVLGALATFDNDDLSTWLQELGLFNFLPFRLVGINLSDRKLREWTWDGDQLSTPNHGWRANHWFSSGISDANAAEIRGKLFETGRAEPDSGTMNWLRRMHRSHGSAPGAFSVCVHRDDAATVSYTEVEVTAAGMRMRYLRGSPCLDTPVQELGLPLTQPYSHHSL
jgi:transport and Golgi organization protein 2